MRLKQIQMQGFKSFVERTVVDFTDNITCVVGPNGCGKSNIVDAIRWAMGEMSAKQLRGGAMEDVIFHGTDDMAPVGMAEVTLVFDNSQGLAPPEYNSFSEIQVTRRLFRSGDSEYYINRTPCRLKDITDLFLGSGAGTKAYSIIEQGRIDEIITMKPDQRRVLIEEAAGVSRYRVRRQEAARKMEATRNNLVRIRDIIAELKRQMNSLNRQAKKAERYKKYREEMRDLELELAAYKAMGLRKKTEEAEAQAASIRDREERLASSLEAEDAALERMKADLSELEQELKTWQNRLVESSRAVEKSEQALVMLKHRRDLLERDQARLGEEKQALGLKRTALKEEIEGLEAEIARLKKDILHAESELGRAQQHKTDKNARCQEMMEAAEVLERHLINLNNNVERLEQKMEWARARREELSQKTAETKKRRSEAEQEMERLARENMASNERLHKLKKELSELQAARQEEEQKLARAETSRAVCADRLESLKTREAHQEARLSSLKEMETNYEGYQTGVKAIMARKAELEVQGKNGTFGLIADVMQTDPEYELAVEAVLGERLQSIAVKDIEHGLDNIMYLKERGGRSNFVPVQDIAPPSESLPEPLAAAGAVLLSDKVEAGEEFAPAVRAMLAGAVVVPDIRDGARILAEHGLKRDLVTRDGVMMDRVGALSGGSPDSFSGILAKKREIEELAESLASLAAERERAEQELSRQQAAIFALSEKVEKLRESCYRIEIEKNNQEKDLRQGTQAYNAAKQDLAVAHEEFESLERAARETENETARVRDMIEKDREAAERIGPELEQRRHAIAELQAEVDRHERRWTEARVKTAGLRERLESAHLQLERLERSLEETAAGIDKRKSELESVAESLSELEREEAEARKVRHQAVEAAMGLEEGASAERDRYERKLSQTREQEEKIKKLGREKEQSRSERMEAELSLSQLKMQWENLCENVREKFSRELETAVSQMSERFSEDYPHGQREQRREELRSKLDRMGDVNLTAIEEYEEISQRHGFLSGQEADLIQALENLEATIAKINNAYRKSFKKTFVEVNQSFQQVLPRLFRGGKGSLELTDPDNLLESGVEIMVQLPGKRTTSISLLSGGEKSLTATGLIIALFLVKPSPFCMLDEVDAALDDANIMRFNEIIRELAERSQLILVTHNKRTMELAHTLYGVTMEKKGVSKIVSVRLKDAGETHAA